MMEVRGSVKGKSAESATPHSASRCRLAVILKDLYHPTTGPPLAASVQYRWTDSLITLTKSDEDLTTACRCRCQDVRAVPSSSLLLVC
jgi:hypothetical protein